MKASTGYVQCIIGLVIVTSSLCYERVRSFSQSYPQIESSLVTIPRRKGQLSTLCSQVLPNNNESESQKDQSKECPFSMTFTRYRIPISGGKDKGNDNTNILSGLFSGVLISARKAQFEGRYSNLKDKNRKILWYDPKLALEPNQSKNDDKKVVKGKIGIHTSAFVWRTLSDLLDDIAGESLHKQSITAILGLPNSSLLGLKQLADIINWMTEQHKLYQPPKSNTRINLHASVDEESPVPTMILSVRRQNEEVFHDVADSNIIRTENDLSEDIIRERTMSWVDRVLVKMKICPFTRSTTKSGQGLGDVGVPVGNIAYHYSKASQFQFPTIMAGKSLV